MNGKEFVRLLFLRTRESISHHIGTRVTSFVKLVTITADRETMEYLRLRN